MEGGRGGTADFDDWEMLLADEEENGELGVAAEAVADGMLLLRHDYFSIDTKIGDKSDLLSEEGSLESDNPSWVDPAGSEAVAFGRRNSGELWPDSASDRSKLSDSGEKLGLEFVQSGDDNHGFEMHDRSSESGKLGYDSTGEYSAEVNAEAFQDVEMMGAVSVDKEDIIEFKSDDVTNETEMGTGGEENSVVAAEDGKIGKEMEQKAVIWWKLPLELVKFCVFRVSPLWSISVAAAMVGVFIMRRRLQNMKRKTKSLQLKVTVDDKKVDQFMTRAARLNEAFSVAKRVPLIRPSLPAPGVSPWPVMSMR